MFGTTHILASVVISQHVPNPWWAFLISLFSHYLLDFIPHGDAQLGPWMVADPKKRRLLYVLGSDALFALFLLVGFWFNGNLPGLSTLIPAMIGGILPDLIWIASHIIKEYGSPKLNSSHFSTILNQIHAFHHTVHIYIDHKIKNIWPGVVIQVSFFCVLIYFIVSWR